VFRDGFFHADLHPGNIFVLPDNTLAVVDFGIMGRISRQDQLYLAEMLWAFLNKKYEKVAEIHRNAGFVPSDISIKQFALANRAIAEPIFNKPLNEISVGKLLGQLFMVAEHFKMETQPQLLLLQKTMVLAEGVGRMFQPDVNMWKLAEPLIADWAKQNLGPTAQVKDIADEGLQALKRLPALVRQSEQVLLELQRGGIRLHPKTVEAMRGNSRRATRQWVNFARLALLLLGGILLLEILH
jgi:ubiquinone biosynthesis protein